MVYNSNNNSYNDNNNNCTKYVRQFVVFWSCTAEKLSETRECP